MTPEERGLEAVRQAVTPESWESVGPEMAPVVWSPIYQPVVDAIRAAVVEEREACARAVCVGCENGWPAEDCDGDLLHVLPESLREPATQYTRGTHTGCEAAAIRARV